MSQDADRLLERAAFNYLDVDPSIFPYNMLKDEELADYFLQIPLFNSGIWQWDRVADNIVTAAHYAKSLKRPEAHGVWIRLFRHALSAPSQEDREKLLSHSIAPKSLSSRNWVKFAPALRFDVLAAEIHAQGNASHVLGQWSKFKRFFPETRLHAPILCAVSIIYHESGNVEDAKRLLSWLSTYYPAHFELKKGGNLLRSRIHYVRERFPELEPHAKETVSLWKKGLSVFDKRQLGVRYPEFRRLYQKLMTDDTLSEKARKEIRLNWQSFLKDVLDLRNNTSSDKG